MAVKFDSSVYDLVNARRFDVVNELSERFVRDCYKTRERLANDLVAREVNPDYVYIADRWWIDEHGGMRHESVAINKREDK